MKKISIAVLITCYNRFETTKTCLENLFAQNGLGEKYTMDVFLVDDNSPDATADRISIIFPQIQLINGTGNLFWNRGMRLAWQRASEKEVFDYFLWLNDDTFLFSDSITMMLAGVHSNAVVVGSTINSNRTLITYGGFSKNHKQMVPNGTFELCHYFNGNCVLIPREVFTIVGMLDPTFHHAVGDFDYGLRANKKGIELLMAPDFVGYCDEHIGIPLWCNAAVSIRKRFKFLYSPLSGCMPSQFFLFERRHYGLSTALFHFVTLHIRALFPHINKLKPIKSSRIDFKMPF